VDGPIQVPAELAAARRAGQRGGKNSVASRVVDRETEEEAIAPGRQSLGRRHFPDDDRRQAVPPPDYLDADPVLQAALCLRPQVDAQKPHQGPDLRGRTLPVVC